MKVRWSKPPFGWYAFLGFDLSTVGGYGVYVIWHDGNPGRTIYVGQGDLRPRLAEHRKDPAITQYATHGTLRVTWAVIPWYQADGVERYLAETLPPLIADERPDAAPIAVNW
jgi:hypothetical protein